MTIQSSRRGCCSCPAATCHGCPAARLSRRDLLAGAGAALALSAMPPGVRAMSKDPARQQPIRLPLKVQPVFAYATPERRQATSWREWGGIHTEAEASQEKERIGRELAALKASAEFPLEILPLAVAKTPEEAGALARSEFDVALSYAAGGSGKIFEVLTAPGRWHIMFLRHRSGPVYLWYEIAHPRFLRKTVDAYGQPGMDVQDVVVDSQPDILVRLRALGGLKNTLGKRIVAVGGAGGWGAGGRTAPDRSRELWKLDIREVSYPDLGRRIQRARADAALVRRSQAEADRYLKQKGVTLETSKQFVANAFLLTEVFRDLLDEAATDAFTINDCMDTIMPMSETTACLPLSLLNDDGYMAFCESDFVVIPSGILLRYISGKPVFLNDPTHPHDGVVTLAHCTAPRKMDGARAEPARIMTHFESDYGAAPKVEMKKGQRVTNLVPDFASRRWLGFEGEVLDNPNLAICRSQIDVSIHGDTNRLLEQMRGFHWMTAYGSYLRETGYALRKAGVEWSTLG
jgi:hypothetical protein